MHVACLTGAAQLLAEGKQHLTGTLIALFQPAEEVGNGARGMVEAGLADLISTPHVALAQHVLPGRAGQVATHADAHAVRGGQHAHHRARPRRARLVGLSDLLCKCVI